MRTPRAIPGLCLLLLAAAAFSAAAQSEEEVRKRILEAAARYRGVPYMYGAESPAAFDCSGFVRYVYRQAAGISLPRSSRGIFASGIPVDPKKARPGDVLVYDTVGGAPSHVAIYLGEGSVIHAVSQGPRTGVIVSPPTDSYFPPRLIAARSFLGTEGSSGSKVPPPSAPARPPAAGGSGGSSPAPGSASAPPAAQASPEETPIADIGFTIPGERAAYSDPIPAAAGTRIAFTLTNGTGKSGNFIVIFYKADPQFQESREIHREKARIPAGGSLELPAYLFSEPGRYKLIVKDTWNTQLMERTFTVKGR